jgi:hypothetical protein
MHFHAHWNKKRFALPTWSRLEDVVNSSMDDLHHQECFLLTKVHRDALIMSLENISQLKEIHEPGARQLHMLFVKESILGTLLQISKTPATFFISTFFT